MTSDWFLNEMEFFTKWSHKADLYTKRVFLLGTVKENNISILFVYDFRITNEIGRWGCGGRENFTLTDLFFCFFLRYVSQNLYYCQLCSLVIRFKQCSCCILHVLIKLNIYCKTELIFYEMDYQ